MSHILGSYSRYPENEMVKCLKNVVNFMIRLDLMKHPLKPADYNREIHDPNIVVQRMIKQLQVLDYWRSRGGLKK